MMEVWGVLLIFVGAFGGCVVAILLIGLLIGKQIERSYDWCISRVMAPIRRWIDRYLVWTLTICLTVVSPGLVSLGLVLLRGEL